MHHQPDYSHERDLSIDELVKRVATYHPEADFALLKKGHEFAAKAHENQKRSSGEDYIIHPINVAATLIKLKMDMDSIVAGLLHDVLEDCNVTVKDIENEFSSSIAQIVVGLTKISKIKIKTVEEIEAENFRKMVVAMAKDLRVLIVKLADRMHNMRTLQYISEEKQKKIARETMDIYVPLAGKLGIQSIKRELEDLCLRFLSSKTYYELAEKIETGKAERNKYIKEVLDVIQDKFISYTLKAHVTGEIRNLFSIYKKMNFENINFEQIQDILSFHIIVGNITECYKALGIIHSAFIPIPGRFKDYIAIPKVNNYQSLHTVVVGPKAERIEIKIRTSEMDQIAEIGVASHWCPEKGSEFAKKVQLDWVQELLEFNQDVGSNQDFMDVVKNDLNIDEIFVFTPNGDVHELQYEATPLDFAYAVHTEVGNRCVGAKVNGKIVSLKHRLKSGDTIEILTNDNQTPSKNWLDIVKTGRAKTRIKQWLAKVIRENNKRNGRDILEKTLEILSLSMDSFKKQNHLERILKKYRVSNEDDLHILIGMGKITARQIVETMSSESEKGTDEQMKKIDLLSTNMKKDYLKRSRKETSVIVKGMKDASVRRGKCCHPVPGDEIIGFITSGRGVSVHTVWCKKIDGNMKRTVKVHWNPSYKSAYPVHVQIVAYDRPGILSQISKTINNTDVNIIGVVAKSFPDGKGNFIFHLEVANKTELSKAMSSIRELEQVIKINRK